MQKSDKNNMKMNYLLLLLQPLKIEEYGEFGKT